MRLLLLVSLLPALLGAERPPGLGDVADVRTWSHPDYTRVVIELTEPAEAGDVQRLAAAAGQSERLYLDLDGIWVGRRWLAGVDVNDGLLQRVRLGQNTKRRARVVLDLERIDRYRVLQLRGPDRVVIDVYGDRRDPETLEWSTSSRSTDRLGVAAKPIRTVILDPGHGGRDPGAIGHKGLREKDVNLRLARKLERILLQRGFRVVATRTKDRSLDLEERTAIAEAAGGDLFISLHANASPRRKTRGLEIYYLDEKDHRHSTEVAARENGIPRSEVDTLQRTLARFRVAEASVHSAELAAAVHDSVLASLGRKRGGPPDLGVKTGPFYVLFLSSMPAILVESGFLTNPSDARLLDDDAFLDALAAGIAGGLEHYRRSAEQLSAKRAP